MAPTSQLKKRAAETGLDNLDESFVKVHTSQGSDDHSITHHPGILDRHGLTSSQLQQSRQERVCANMATRSQG